jgi:hypothetical protein
MLDRCWLAGFLCTFLTTCHIIDLGCALPLGSVAPNELQWKLVVTCCSISKFAHLAS